MFALIRPFVQGADAGAVPTLLAAAGSEVEGGGYYGPRSLGESRGSVGSATIAAAARDENAARRLWSVSEELVGRPFPVSV